jgi:hypothetical protein
MTVADVYVAFALLTLALLMWYARRLVGVLLKLVPAAAALAGTWGAVELYRAGSRLGWDTPGSPGILVIFAALGAAALVAVCGWIAVGLQVRAFMRPARVRSRASSSTRNEVAVAIAIVLVVGALLSGYRYYRSHQPSHDEAVRLMAFARDGESLYSLDRSGVLKKWYAQRALEADRWVLPEQGFSSALVVSGDGQRLATLDGDRLSVWQISSARAAERIALLEHALAAVTIDDERFALLTRTELSIRRWDAATAALASVALPTAALTATAYGNREVVVGFADSTLAFYDASAAGVAPREVALPGSLRAVPRAIRVDRTGRFFAVSDGGTALAVLDLQIGRQDSIPLLSPLGEFAISEQNQLLIAELVAVRRYDLETGTSEPLFNHGGPIGALAASPIADSVAIADRQNIWLRNDSRHYAAPEVWLRGAVQVARLADAVLPGERFAR